MFTAVFSLDSVDADDLRWHPDRCRQYPHVECTPLSPRELAALAALTCGDTQEALLEKMQLLAGESQESPWVISIPDNLVATICGLKDDHEADLALRWQQSGGSTAQLDVDTLRALIFTLRDFLTVHPGPFALLVLEALK